MDRTDDEIREVLIAWIKLALDDDTFQTIEANQRGKEPSGAYGSLLIITSTSIGLGATREGLFSPDTFGYDGGEGEAYGFDQAAYYEDGIGSLVFKLVSSSLRDVNVSLNFFRDDAHENMRKIMHFPNTNTSKEFLFDKGVSLFVPDSYRNLDDLEADGFIKRAQIDFHLHCATEYVETVNAVDEVDLSIEI